MKDAKYAATQQLKKTYKLSKTKLQKAKAMSRQIMEQSNAQSDRAMQREVKLADQKQQVMMRKAKESKADALKVIDDTFEEKLAAQSSRSISKMQFAAHAKASKLQQIP